MCLGDAFENQLSLNRSTAGWGGGMQRGPLSTFSESDSFLMISNAHDDCSDHEERNSVETRFLEASPAEIQLPTPKPISSSIRTWLCLCLLFIFFNIFY